MVEPLKRFSLPPSGVNPYITSIVHKYWDSFYRQYPVCIKQAVDKLPMPVWQETDPELKYVDCKYWVSNKILTLALSGHRHGTYCIYNGKIDKESIRLWPISQILYHMSKVYSLVREDSNLCSTNVEKPSAHETADAILTVGMMDNWRIG